MNEVVHDIATKHAAEAGGLLPCLHEVQDRLGFIPADSHAQLAEVFRSQRLKSMASSVFTTTFVISQLLAALCKSAVPRPARRWVREN